MQPGILVAAPAKSETALQVMETTETEAPILRQLRGAIDGYRLRVASWEQAVRPLAIKQGIPSNTTIGLFGLGSVLCIAVNAFALSTNTPTQEIALSNLGCITLFAIAGISLFYDRVVRGFAGEVLVRQSAENAAEIAVQLQALAELQVDLQRRVHQLNQELGGLAISIEKQNDIAEDLKQQNLTAQAHQKDYDAKLVDLRSSIMGEASRLNRLQHNVSRLEDERKELQLSIQAHTDSLLEVAARREDVSADLMVLESTRESMRSAWAVEQEEGRIEAAKLNGQLRSLNDQRSEILAKIETTEADLIHLSDLRSELQTEIELIGLEHERRTAASIAAISQLQSKIDGLQQDHDRRRAEFDQLQSAIRYANADRESIENRIAQCAEAKLELEDTIVASLGQLQENRELLVSVQHAILAEEDNLAQRRLLAEREAVEADSRQEERNRWLQDLERKIAVANQERDAIGAEIDRLEGVQNAMDISIDELTNRLESRTTELRLKNTQLQEQAERLERLSEAIQKLAIRESEIRRAITDSPVDSVFANSIPAESIVAIPGQNGVIRNIHGPHLTPLSRTTPIPPSSSSELIEG
jgi:chromosome segregation ATPase